MESDPHMLLVLAYEQLQGDIQARSTETVWVHVTPRNECTGVGSSFVRQCWASIQVSVMCLSLLYHSSPDTSTDLPLWPHYGYTAYPGTALASLHACGVKMVWTLSSPTDFNSAKISSVVLILTFYSREKPFHFLSFHGRSLSLALCSALESRLGFFIAWHLAVIQPDLMPSCSGV